MELSDNKYYYQIMCKYYIILIEMNLFEYRKNPIPISKSDDDKTDGMFHAMNEISETHSVICINFDKNYPVQESNIHFIDTANNPYNSTVPCDFMFLFGVTVDIMLISKLYDYYNPKFIFYS